MDSKAELRRYRNQLGFQKSHQYLEWMKKMFPNLDLHHILGSFTGKKMTDYLVVPLTHFEHIKNVHGKEQNYFLDHLPIAVRHLKNYARQVLKVDAVLVDLEPQSINNLIELIYKEENK